MVMVIDRNPVVKRSAPLFEDNGREGRTPSASTVVRYRGVFGAKVQREGASGKGCEGGMVMCEQAKKNGPAKFANPS